VALVAMPNCHMLLYHPITDLAVVRALPAMAEVAGNEFRKGPGSARPLVLWWREPAWWLGGQFTAMPEVRERQVLTHRTSSSRRC